METNIQEPDFGMLDTEAQAPMSCEATCSCDVCQALILPALVTCPYCGHYLLPW